MFPFSQSVNPALRAHLDSQLAFFNELSQSLSGSFQSVCEANFKLSQNMVEETLSAGRRMLTSGHASDVPGAIMPDTQPASEHMRAYQRHISQIAAGSQVDLARVTQQHGRETSRTAQALAEEVTRVSVEEADRNLRQKEEFLKNFRDPFQQDASHGGTQAKPDTQTPSEFAGAAMQSETRTGRVPSEDNLQAASDQPAQQSNKK